MPMEPNGAIGKVVRAVKERLGTPPTLKNRNKRQVNRPLRKELFPRGGQSDGEFYFESDRPHVQKAQ